MKSSSGIYKIDKGQRMVGSCHLAQRDRKVFGVPGSKSVNEFDPSRFNAKVSDRLLQRHALLGEKSRNINNPLISRHFH